jgi:hypothetical protein
MFFSVFVFTAIGFVARFIMLGYGNVACIQKTLLKVVNLSYFLLRIINALLIYSAFLDWELLHCSVYIIRYCCFIERFSYTLKKFIARF